MEIIKKRQLANFKNSLKEPVAFYECVEVLRDFLFFLNLLSEAVINVEQRRLSRKQGRSHLLRSV